MKIHAIESALISLTLAFAAVAAPPTPATPNKPGENVPEFWNWAARPPMGWNSYDAFGSSVTEEEMLVNARYVKEHLLAHGWNYVVVDFRWSDPDAAKYNPNGIGGPVTMDACGRLLPAPNRFPSAGEDKGFKPLGDRIHAMGLKFGIHVMRGIPRQAVKANTPIEGSQFHAADAADTKSTCQWCKDMWGIAASTPAGQAYYDSIFRLYASWGVDFVKVDDIAFPYHEKEVEAVRMAIDKSGRPMVLSISPGATPVQVAEHVAGHANMWRVSADFWDKWPSLDHAFELAASWHGTGGPGRWPDLDMIPFGRVGIRCVDGDRRCRFTRDEQVTLMSFWSLLPSPLMLGMNLPDNDDWTLGLLTNDEVIGINQDALGRPAKRTAKQADGGEIWVRDLSDGTKAVGLFNRGTKEVEVALRWADAGLSGKQQIRDLWQRKDLEHAEGMLTLPVRKHGAILLRLKPAAAE